MPKPSAMSKALLIAVRETFFYGVVHTQKKTLLYYIQKKVLYEDARISSHQLLHNIY